MPFSPNTQSSIGKRSVQTCCGFVSKLCKEAGCEEASDLCAKAADAVIECEEKYLQFCEPSCKKCSESRLPKRQMSEKTTYVA